MRNGVFTGVIVTALGLLASIAVEGRDRDAARGHAAQPASQAAVATYCAAVHLVGKITLTATNHACLGSGWLVGSPTDCFTGLPLRTCEYPKGSNTEYLFTATLWVGAVVGNDTLVSVGVDGWQNCREMNPHETMFRRSTSDPLTPEAISEQDYVAPYTDTFLTGVTDLCSDVISGRPHIPLPIEVTQSSYAWSQPEVEDFVIIEYRIKNIGAVPLSHAYVGLYVDADVHDSGAYVGVTDDLSGFTRSVQSFPGSCGRLDTCDIAWIADNDGELSAGTPVPNVTGFTLLASPAENARVSFNWWVSNGNAALDFGPMRKSIARDFGTGGSGTPEGDANKYYLLSNGDIDYDQAYAAVIPADDPIWTAPAPSFADDVALGRDARYLLSYGPFDLNAGESIVLPFAFVGGMALHKVSGNLQNLPGNPTTYFQNLDFTDLIANARTAKLFYDNPGVDTDSDAYLGQYVICCYDSVEMSPGEYQCVAADTVFTDGDGFPDYALYQPPCCFGYRGNVDVIGSIDIADLTLLVDYMFLPVGIDLPCYEQADVDGSGIIDISDLALLVDYLFGMGGPVQPARCP